MSNVTEAEACLLTKLLSERDTEYSPSTGHRVMFSFRMKNQGDVKH